MMRDVYAPQTGWSLPPWHVPELGIPIRTWLISRCSTTGPRQPGLILLFRSRSFILLPMELAHKRNNMPSDLFFPEAKTCAEVCLGLEGAAAFSSSAAVCQSTFFLGVDIDLSVAPRNPICFSQPAVSSFKSCYLSLALTQWHKIAALCASSGQVTQSHFSNSFRDTRQGWGSAGPREQGVLPKPVLLAPAVVFPCPFSAAQVLAVHHSTTALCQGRKNLGPRPGEVGSVPTGCPELLGSGWDFFPTRSCALAVPPSPLSRGKQVHAVAEGPVLAL